VVGDLEGRRVQAQEQDVAEDAVTNGASDGLLDLVPGEALGGRADAGLDL
jgi:hypothetical protein